MAKDRPYHHGNLRDALSARACAKAVGVAPSAVFRHFADKRALATALAAQGFAQMLARIRVLQDQPDAAFGPFTAVGLGYLDHALEHPHLFRLMFRGDALDRSDPDLIAAQAALGTITGQSLGEATSDPMANDRAMLAWSAVHGLSHLAIDGQLDARVPSNPDARRKKLLTILKTLAPALRD